VDQIVLNKDLEDGYQNRLIPLINLCYSFSLALV